MLLEYLGEGYFNDGWSNAVLEMFHSYKI